MNTFPQENKVILRAREKKLARRSTLSAQGRRDKTHQIRILHGVPLLPGDHHHYHPAARHAHYNIEQLLTGKEESQNSKACSVWHTSSLSDLHSAPDKP